MVKSGSYVSFYAKIIFLGKIEMHVIQYSLKRNALYQIWKNTTGSKDNRISDIG